MTVPFLSVKPKSIKLKVSPRFPAQVIGRTGIDVNKANGNYYFDLDYAAFPALSTPTAGTYVAQFDPVSGQFSTAPSVSFAGGAISEAPSDGTSYGRRNAAWVNVLPLTGGTLTGALAIPTAAVDTNTTQAATTAFVLAQASAVGDGTPAMEGVAARGTSTHFARADHVHPIFALRGYLSGLILSTAGASTIFSVAAGIACDSTFTQMMSLATSINKTTAAWAVGSGNGSFDGTGLAPSANAGWYHVHLIMRTDTGVVDVLTSNSATSPTLPSGYSLFRRIGSLLTGGSFNWVPFVQVGDEFIWTVTVNDVNTATLSTASALLALTVPTGVQVNALFRATVASGTAGTSILITSPDASTETAGGVAGNVTQTVINTTTSNRLTMNVRTNTNAQIRAVASAASTTFVVATFGWWDRRGRDS